MVPKKAIIFFITALLYADVGVYRIFPASMTVGDYQSFESQMKSATNTMLQPLQMAKFTQIALDTNTVYAVVMDKSVEELNAYRQLENKGKIFNVGYYHFTESGGVAYDESYNLINEWYERSRHYAVHPSSP